MSYHGIKRDFFLSILGAGVFAGALQLLAYPFLSREQDAVNYGTMLLLMGIVNSIGSALGGALNNARLVRKDAYNELGISGDYSLMFYGSSLVCATAVGTLCFAISRDGEYILGCSVLSLLVLFRSYFSVSFRLTVNYSKMLVMYAVASFGVVVGVALYYFTQYWPTVFLVAEIAACFYLVWRAPEVRDAIRRTPNFRESLLHFFALASSTALASAMMYLDRVVLYPLLGPQYVAIFFVAGYLGKSIGIVLTPMAGVLLTYYSRSGRLKVGQFVRQLFLILTVSAAMFGIISLIAAPVTRLLYPTLAEASLPYLGVANLGALLFIIGGMVQAALVKFAKARWVLMVQCCYLVAFIVMSLFALRHGALFEFLWAVVLANALRVLLISIIVVRCVSRRGLA